MFVAVYAFKVKPGMEEQFRRAWAERTREIIQESASFGSRLHLSDEGVFIGYAQWPSREAWESAKPHETAALLAMRAAMDSVETVYRLEVLDDLIVDAE